MIFTHLTNSDPFTSNLKNAKGLTFYNNNKDRETEDQFELSKFTLEQFAYCKFDENKFELLKFVKTKFPATIFALLICDFSKLASDKFTPSICAPTKETPDHS